jgi:hypothetical protein
MLESLAPRVLLDRTMSDLFPWRRFSALILFLLLLASPLAARAQERRVAVLIGANIGDPGEVRLRYAEADAERLAQTLRSVGDFPADRVLLLTGVSADEVRETLIRLNAQIRDATGGGADGAGSTLLFVFYSGHADETRLHLAGTHLATSELRGLVAGSAAASRVLVIDACRSGALTRVKGGRAVAPFEVTFAGPPLPSGVAILTSSADGEDSQESDRLRASFFSHYFNSGLIGGADANRDARVTLHEAFAFASDQTHAATVGTAAGPQHPTYRFDLGGRSDLVLTRPRATPHRLGSLQLGEPGRYVVTRLERDGASAPVAELLVRTGGARIALSPGRYQVSMRGRDSLYEGQSEVSDGAVTEVSLAQMDRVPYGKMVRKGAGPGYTNSASVGLGVNGPFAGLPAGLAAGLAFRQDRRRFSWEARATLALSTRESFAFSAGGEWVGIDNQLLTVTGLISRTWDLRHVSLSAGVEAGMMALRQTFDGWQQVTGRAVAGPPGLAWGAVAGPVLQLEIPFRFGGYLRLEAAAPNHLFRVESPQNYRVRMKHELTGRLLAGGGFYF